MGRKSVFDYLKRGKFAKAASLLHPGCHQGPNRTALNRYPEVFAAPAPDARRILSFGCSTGEECVTLAEYFPKAEIVGADINPVILLQARKHRSDRIRFVYASDRIFERIGRVRRDLLHGRAAQRRPLSHSRSSKSARSSSRPYCGQAGSW
jgi:trans-aconitate methyltransferase